MQPKELTICGLAAVRAQFATDAGAIKRLYFDYATGRRIGVICRTLAQARKIYRCVEPEELAKIAGTMHHGGIVAVVAAPELRAPAPPELAGWAQRAEPLVVLDRIGNAHNLGAIARTAAFFGVPRLVLAGAAASARPGEAAHRVAEGGLAHLEVLSVPDLPAFLRQLRAGGYEVVGAATRGGRPRAPGKTAAPLALVLGNEEHGLAADVAAACSRLVTLPGSGKVESLNVSVAAGILLWELHARR
jgi:TrmH RNA methyltransferase